MLDVLEHLIDPVSCLKKIHKHLLQRAKVIVSLPNIAHWSIRRNLLFGNFDYCETGGLLDVNHRNFFTLNSARRAFLIAQYRIIREEYFTYGLPLFNAKRPFLNKLSNQFPLKQVVSTIVKQFPGLFTYQFLFVLEESNITNNG